MVDLARQAEGFFQDLSQGKVTQGVPDMAAIPEAFRGPAFDGFMSSLLANGSLDPRVRQGLVSSQAELRQVFISGDTRQVAKLAARAALTPLVDEALTRVRSRLDSQSRIDLAALAQQQWQGAATWAEVQPQVEEARRWAARLPMLGMLALAGIAGGALVMGLVHLPRLSKALGFPGLTLLLTGAAFFGLSRLMASPLLDRLDRLVERNTAQLSTMPPSVVDLVTDVMAALARQLTEGFLSPAIAMMAIGTALLFAAAVAFLVQPRSLSLD